MRTFLRFPISASDDANIDNSSISVTDYIEPSPPAITLAGHQALDISFSKKSSGDPAPQIRPMFPGTLGFIVDPNAPGVIPDDPGTVSLTPGSASAWKTKGTLILAFSESDLNKIDEFEAEFSSLEIAPTHIWYHNIQLTESFLFDTLIKGKGLTKYDIIPGNDKPKIRTSDSNWSKYAIIAFLNGKYRPKLVLGTDAANDGATSSMPKIIDESGQYRLLLSMAVRKDPQDGPRNDPLLTSNLSLDDVSHIRNSPLPARHVLRSIRSRLIDGGTDMKLADNALQDWPGAPRYFLIRCTRTWNAIKNSSVHFTRQMIKVTPSAGGQPLFDRRVPVSGLVYLKQDVPSGAPDVPPAPSVTVNFTGPLKWKEVTDNEVWKQAPDSVPIDVNFETASSSSLHIQLRRPMNEEMTIEPADTHNSNVCTYFSMRRVVRALVNNRIAGGRLNYGRTTTSKLTRKIIDLAWTSHDGNSDMIANNRPIPRHTHWNRAARSNLQPILRSFFDEVRHGKGTPNEIRLGDIAYNIWQSILDSMLNPALPEIYPANVIGRGGAGALVLTGLATGYTFDGIRANGESDASFFRRQSDALLHSIEPGDVIQVWLLEATYASLRARKKPTTDTLGHSPVLYRVNGTTIELYDQNGINKYEESIEGDVIKYSWPEVWVVANWAE